MNSIVLGPKITGAAVVDWTSMFKGEVSSGLAHLCNCIGPQPGQTKCPCALRGESEQGRRMIEDGVVIDGQKYRLVPDEGTRI